jgi:hypothetical protein
VVPVADILIVPTDPQFVEVVVPVAVPVPVIKTPPMTAIVSDFLTCASLVTLPSPTLEAVRVGKG